MKGGAYFLATMMLLMGVQSMYQKFYSAKTPREAKTAVGLWIIGTIVVETVVVVIAIYGASANWVQLKTFDISRQLQTEVSASTVPVDLAARVDALVSEGEAAGQIKPSQAVELRETFQAELYPLHGDREAVLAKLNRMGDDPASIVLVAARNLTGTGWLGLVAGMLLLAAACVVVLSTGMNYLLSPSTNIMRDIYQRFIRPDAPSERMVALQKVFIVVLGVCAFLMIFIPTVLKLKISVLSYSYFAYTMYGVSITPALLAALSWKRATKLGGTVSIISGAFVALLLEIVVPNFFPEVMRGPVGSQDPWGIPSIYPALLISVLALVVVSYLTPPPDPEKLKALFPEH